MHSSKKITHILILIVLSIPLIAQETVFVKAAELGRGILKERGGECFVITPNHVVKKSKGKTIKIVGDKHVVSEAKFVQGFNSDLAVLRIVGGEQQYCAFWEVDEEFTDILGMSFEGVIELRREDGSVQIIPVHIVEGAIGYITVEPKNASNFAKGMSGSSLFTKVSNRKIYLGMLQEVANGQGFVLPADDIMRFLSKFFDQNKKFKEDQSEQELIEESITKNYLNKEFSKHLKFINDHFEELQNGNSRRLKNKFSSFLKKMNDVYSEYPDELNLVAQDKLQYINLLESITEEINNCKELINQNSDSWDVLSITHISQMHYYIEEVIDLIN